MAFYHEEITDNSPNENAATTTTKLSSGSYSLVKVFLYMFAMILFTAAIDLVFSAIFEYLLFNTNAVNSVTTAYLVIMIVAAIGLLIATFVVQRRVFKGNKSLLVPILIYCGLMGIFLSSFTLFVDWWIIGLALGISSLLFAIMAAFSFLIKGTGTAILVTALALGISGSLMGLVCWIMVFTGALSSEALAAWLYGICFIMLAFILLITLFDVIRIKKIASSGEMTKNLSLYCAFTIYIDFVYIFIRVLQLVLLIASRMKK